MAEEKTPKPLMAALWVVIVFAIALLLWAVASIFGISFGTKPISAPAGVQERSDRELAIEKAEELFEQKLAEGMDMNDGPCLSDEIIPDWVVDVAHSPREPVDNLSKNQCSAYREGKAHHFVELDPEGNLIGAN